LDGSAGKKGCLAPPPSFGRGRGEGVSNNINPPHPNHLPQGEGTSFPNSHYKTIAYIFSSKSDYCNLLYVFTEKVKKKTCKKY